MSNLPLNKNQTAPAYYSGFYKTTLPVNGQQYDAVYTFFLRRSSNNKSAAEALTATIMTIAQNRGINPISIIEEFKKLNDDVSFKAALIALMNSDRRPTSKLGYSVQPKPNELIARNVGK